MAAAAQEGDDRDDDPEFVELRALAKEIEAQNVDDGGAGLDFGEEEDVLHEALPVFVILVGDVVVLGRVADSVGALDAVVAFVERRLLYTCELFDIADEPGRRFRRSMFLEVLQPLGELRKLLHVLLAQLETFFVVLDGDNSSDSRRSAGH